MARGGTLDSSSHILEIFGLLLTLKKLSEFALVSVRTVLLPFSRESGNYYFLSLRSSLDNANRSK
jgi:hypothetical protein